MRTRIKGSWVVGHRNGGHTLIKDGEVVYDGDKIVFVGRGFTGEIQEEIDGAGMLVAPGFIDTHVHAGYGGQKRLISDVGRPDFFGQPLLEFDVPRKGTFVGGDQRHAPESEKARFANDPWALFTAVELLRNGVTTFVEMGATVAMQEKLAEAVTRLGTRGYLGAGYDLGGWVAGAGGKLERVIDHEAGAKAFADAVTFSKAVDGTANGRLKAILSPKKVETCSIEQLKETARLARELNFPVCIHAAYNVHEFYDVLREHLKTPVQFLEHVGLLQLGPALNIGHGNFVAEHRRLAYSGGDDIALIGQHRCTVSHCAVNLVRRARFLDTWTKYRKAGVNLALGSDTFPRDMMMQMRTASYFGKVLEHDLQSSTAAEVFEAATVNGATSLNRGDLGRLMPGAKADIILIDMAQGDNLRYGPVRDPIRSLVDCGIGDDVHTVIVDGRVCMRERKIPGVDYGELRRAAQTMSEYIWSHWQDWDSLGRSADEMCPMSYPVE
jgi:cytosine/adenosine deaminase-related metal-dependent hydrolase